MRAEEGCEPFITEVAINLDTGAVATARLPGAVPGDFPQVPPALVGEWLQWLDVAQ